MLSRRGEVCLRLPKKEPDNNKRRERRNIFRYMDAEAVKDHDDAEHKYRIHRAVFQIDILLDALDVADSQLAYQERAKAVAE